MIQKGAKGEVPESRGLRTGAASGIGRVDAGSLARAGAGMRVLDPNGEAAEKVAANIGGWTAQ